MPYTIALVGGTGPEGRGLATRFALAGHRVVIGSRDAERGRTAAADLASTLGREVTGSGNEEAVTGADVVIVVVPYSAHRATLEGLRAALAGKVVVDAVVPVMFDRGPRPIEGVQGSATEEAEAILPESTVIGAFHNVAAEVLLDPEASVDADVLVTGANGDAKTLVMGLADEIKGCRAVDAGPLRFSRFVEGLTILEIGINGRYKAHSGIRITGLPS